MNGINKILCVMPKYSFGDIKKGISPEYNAIYKPIKKNYEKVYFFNSLSSKNLKKINRDLINKVKKIKPELIFFAISSYEINIETLIEIKNHNKCLLINWCSDDEWRFDQHSKILSPYFDCMITTCKKAQKKYLEQKKFSILSHWGCPDNWVGKPLPSRKCKYEVTFVGKSYFDRKNLINYLKTNNINVQCYGYGWGTRILKDSEISKIFRLSKISLNFSSTRGSNKVTKARVFEVTGSGGFLLTERSDNLLNFFSLNQISIFDDKEQLLTNIKKILKNIKIRDRMVKSSSKKAKIYSYSSIINKIINQIRKAKIKPNKKFLYIKNSKNLSFVETFLLKIYKFLSFAVCVLIFDKNKSLKISRRILFEIEWRIRKEKTYSKTGWCFNLFGII